MHIQYGLTQTTVPGTPSTYDQERIELTRAFLLLPPYFLIHTAHASQYAPREQWAVWSARSVSTGSPRVLNSHHLTCPVSLGMDLIGPRVFTCSTPEKLHAGSNYVAPTKVLQRMRSCKDEMRFEATSLLSMRCEANPVRILRLFPGIKIR